MRKITYLLSLVFIFTIPWEGVIEVPGMGTAAKLIGFALAGSWVATVVLTNRVRKPGLFQILVSIFVLWNGMSVFWSIDPRGTLGHLMRWVQLLVMVFILWDLYTSKGALLAGLQAFVLGEYVAISIAVYNFFFGNPYYAHYERFTPSSQSNPDGFGFMVVLGIPLAWYLASLATSGKLSTLFKILNYAYIPFAFVGLSLSGTRTALIASILGMAFGLATLTRLRLAARVAIFVFLAVAIMLLLPHVQDLRSFQRFGTTYGELTQGDLNNRTNNWQEGLASFSKHPFLGVGSDMYRSVNRLGKLAHNSYISVLVELGLVGFLIFGAILALTVFTAFSQSKWEASFWLTVLAMWAIGASTLTYEYRKATWLLLSLAIANAGLISQSHQFFPITRFNPSTNQFLRRATWHELPQGELKRNV
jgi:O-antigen ligase